jgi:hypothetical protein
MALLDAAADRVDAATPSAVVNRQAADEMQYTLRLIQMASEKVAATISAFDPHI